ncbi:hypothetical protein FEE95_14910 [Maribacter algarum]|uniref:Uncharacterized protein n=1 Tax=Maribacter algarum (ex Zhang et al. 2020) TaxID=2578118 RepID=A0A5S3PPN1_9FLAO|nr:hypothetical protein FEE95_14910 [Maribacter algarum]
MPITLIDSTDVVEKVQVLNFATFHIHMGATSDATSVDFDENDKKNQNDAKKIAQLISEFKPTIICVEVPWGKNEELDQEYKAYLTNPSKVSTYYGEVGMVAFEVGRLSNLESIYGIDHKMGYNYNIGQEIENTIDSTTYNNYYKNPFAFHSEINVNHDELSLLEKLKLYNNPKFLDFLINVNADMLAFAGSENGFEGADEAAKYYQRNLRIYSNLNRIPMTIKDRVFILSGGSHTAFLGEFMGRSPKYELVDVMDYL